SSPNRVLRLRHGKRVGDHASPYPAERSLACRAIWPRPRKLDELGDGSRRSERRDPDGGYLREQVEPAEVLFPGDARDQQERGSPGAFGCGPDRSAGALPGAENVSSARSVSGRLLDDRIELADKQRPQRADRGDAQELRER